MEPTTFELRDEYIELNQLLKLVGTCSSGGAGKMLVAQGRVQVDGAVELRKTCKIRAGQVVTIEGRTIQVVAAR
ncbi:MAG: RNA-binding S4 domain-containing protein [Flavobacteriales bacterium]|nr:RNA-binding S4 domain-containing protein [Flavobacteriales bacterium]